jgi:hypothetical protein
MDLDFLILALIVTLIGCASSFALGFQIGASRKLSAATRAAITAASIVCPNCQHRVRDAKGHFIKPGSTAYEQAKQLEGIGQRANKYYKVADKAVVIEKYNAIK